MKYDFMIRNKYAWLVVMAFVSISTFAQKAERDYIRKGNRAFKDSIYVDAEVDYRKALDANPKSTIAHFNLGNTLLWQNKAQEAMNEFVDAARIEKDKGRKAQIFHNIGVIFHSTKEYAKAIEAYKESLRNNPNEKTSNRISRTRIRTNKTSRRSSKSSNKTKINSKTSNNKISSKRRPSRSRTKCPRRMPSSC